MSNVESSSLRKSRDERKMMLSVLEFYIMKAFNVDIHLQIGIQDDLKVGSFNRTSNRTSNRSFNRTFNRTFNRSLQ